MPRLKPLRGLQVNWSHPLARYLTGCWLLNEAAGEITADYGLRRQPGSFQYSTAAPAWKPAVHGSCLEFGTERYLACGTGKLGWDVTNELSIVAYVNQAASQSSTIFARSAFVRPARLTGYTGGKFRWWVYTDGADCNIISTSAHATDGTEWVHVAGTWKQHDGRIYVNGQLESSESSTSGNLSFISGSQPVGIGGTYEGGSYQECWTGKIEYVLVYSRVLSPAEIQWLHREPFAMFERSVSPASVSAAGATVSLAGSVNSTSSASAQLESVLSWPALERTWLLDALFNGMSANAFKLGTTLHLGWFWVRVTGCCALYRGPDMGRIDFADILAVAASPVTKISPPDYLPHESSSTYFYVLRKFNCCGDPELTLSAAAKISFDTSGELAAPKPNKIFAPKAEQVGANTVRLTWLYCPLRQESPPVRFNLYSDNGTGQIDFNNPIAAMDYQGPRFYRYQSNALQPGRYLFRYQSTKCRRN